MNVLVGDRTALWELVAAVPLFQGSPDLHLICGPDDERLDAVDELLSVQSRAPNHEDGHVKLATDEAYRVVDTSKLPYCRTLLDTTLPGAKLSARPYHIAAEMSVTFPERICASEDGPIVVCCYAPKSELELPAKLWRVLVNHLRTYHVPLCFMGAHGQRLDSVAFTESEIAAEESFSRKLEILASARLIVGVPCEWLWLATGLEKKMVVLYPDSMPTRRWFHFEGKDKQFRIIAYDPRNIQVPLLLAALRHMIRML